MPDTTLRRRRDPAQRRREIVTAAAELITEVGTAKLTHRLVAARAAVPLGSTTQYFATLDDLREAAMAELAEGIDAGLREVADTLERHGPDTRLLGRQLHDYLSDERLVRSDLALVTAAFTDPALRPLALRWSDGMLALLTPHVGGTAARAITAFLDGVALQALFHPPVPADELGAVLAALAATGDQP